METGLPASPFPQYAVVQYYTVYYQLSQIPILKNMSVWDRGSLLHLIVKLTCFSITEPPWFIWNTFKHCNNNNSGEINRNNAFKSTKFIIYLWELHTIYSGLAELEKLKHQIYNCGHDVALVLPVPAPFDAVKCNSTQLTTKNAVGSRGQQVYALCRHIGFLSTCCHCCTDLQAILPSWRVVAFVFTPIPPTPPFSVMGGFLGIGAHG